MKFGLLYEIDASRTSQTGSLHDGFWRALEQVKVAEAAGFDSVWSVEHQLLDPASRASAPEIWLAAVAQHTERIRIGHAARLLPFEYNSPIRVAEMAAVLDIMSGGRLEFGTGRSASAVELEGVGIDPTEMRAQWDEALRMIPKMWMQEEFSWKSEHFEMPPRNVLPKPVQAPHPPLWMSGTRTEAAVWAGEWGVGFMHLSLSDPVGMGAQVASYREAIGRASPVGAVVNERFAAFATLFCGTSDDDAAGRAGAAICGDANLAERVDRHSAIVGSPERCIEGIEWYASQGVDEMIFAVEMGPLAHDDVCDSLRRFGREVIPHFRSDAKAR